MPLPETNYGPPIAVESEGAGNILAAGDFDAIIRAAERRVHGRVVEVFLGDEQVGVYLDHPHHPPAPSIRT